MKDDLVYSVRFLLRNKRFAALVIATIALGIGATTAIYSVMYAALLQVLPVHDPGWLVMFEQVSAEGSVDDSFSYPVYRDLRDRAAEAGDLVAYSLEKASVNYGERTERLNVELVSGNYFQTLGIGAARGRLITPEDDRIGQSPVAVISYNFWKLWFDGDASVLGRKIRINGFPFTVIGIDQRSFKGFTLGAPASVQIPMAMEGQFMPSWRVLEKRFTSWLKIFARIKPGVTEERAQAIVNTTFQQISKETLPGGLPAKIREDILAERIRAQSAVGGRSVLRGRYAQPLTILMGIVLILLLIACSNFASILVARGAMRSREVAIRMAVGASRSAVSRQLVLESMLLALIGGLVSLAPAILFARALISFLPTVGPHAVALSIRIEPRLLLFAIAVSLGIGALFGIIPSWASSRVDLLSTLHGTATGKRKSVSVRLRSSLVVAQLALALVLLSATGILARTLYNLKNVNLGFQKKNVLLFSVEPSEHGYTKKDAPALYERLLSGIERIPGVRSASVSLIDVASGRTRRDTISIPGYTPQPNENMNVDTDVVGPRFLKTFGIQILAGRDISRSDTADSPRIAIVNQSFVHKYFSREQPLGRTFYFGRPGPGNTGIHIVGIVKDVRFSSLRHPQGPMVFVPLSQEPVVDLTIAVKTILPPYSLLPSLRKQVRSVDAMLPVFYVRTMEQQIDSALIQERLLADMAGAFGVISLVLAAIGLYGIVSYITSRRLNEVAIRMALGAKRWQVMALLIRQTGLLVVLGIALGGALAASLLRFLSSQLYGVSTTDPATATAAILLLAVVAVIAGVIPAKRAMKLDVSSQLRLE